MTDGELAASRVMIVPEPTEAELVVILRTLQGYRAVEPPQEESINSNWSQAARREQLRSPLDAGWSDWNR